MVSFQCSACNDVVKKPKLKQHAQRCTGFFTCLDCSTEFPSNALNSHTSCITETEKYQKHLKKPATEPISLIKQLSESKRKAAEEEDKKQKKQKTEEWNKTVLEQDDVRCVELALREVLKQHTSFVSIGDARKKTLALIGAHPQKKWPKKEGKKLKKVFEKTFGFTLRDGKIWVGEREPKAPKDPKEQTKAASSDV